MKNYFINSPPIMNKHAKTYLLAIFCIVFQLAITLGIKVAFMSLKTTPTFLAQGIIYSVGVFLMGVYAVLWQLVLKSLPLSVANSMMSMVPVLILGGGVFFFHEKVNINNITGFALIISGLLMIAFSKRKNPGHA